MNSIYSKFEGIAKILGLSKIYFKQNILWINFQDEQVVSGRTRRPYNFEHNYYWGSAKSKKSSKFCILETKLFYSRAAKRTFGAQGKVLKWGPSCIGITFVNLFCMHFNVKLSLSSYILSAMPMYIKSGKLLIQWY